MRGSLLLRSRKKALIESSTSPSNPLVKNTSDKPGMSREPCRDKILPIGSGGGPADQKSEATWSDSM